MSTIRNTWRASSIAAGVLLAAVSAAMAQTPNYPQRDQQRTLDQMRIQRQQTDQRLGDDLTRQRQIQEQRAQQQQYEDQLRRQRLQEQHERR